MKYDKDKRDKTYNDFFNKKCCDVTAKNNLQ